MNDLYIYAIAALLPLTGCMLIFQTNPYHALVLRGILGAIAALVYAVLGAADVGLTEALVGTMLAITLYAVAVRSSLVMRLGVLQEQLHPVTGEPRFEQLLDRFRTILSKRHMRLEVFPYPDRQALEQALLDKEVHTTYTVQVDGETLLDRTVTRVQRLYEIIQAESSLEIAYVKPANDAKEKH